MIKHGHLISRVDPGSIAEELELEPGDMLLTIDGDEIEDIFDYEYRIDNEAITMVVRKKNGEEWELDIENEYQDLGLTFENGLMSDYRSCRNKCIFCFIDQMPPGMRETLYFKDDDSISRSMADLKGLSSGICSNIHGNMASPVNMSGRARLSNSARWAFSSAAAQRMGMVSPSA